MQGYHKTIRGSVCIKITKYANRSKKRLIESITKAFENFGFLVYDNPWKFIIIPILFCCLFSTGFFVRVKETNMDILYSLPESPSVEAKRELIKAFNIPRVSYILAVSKNNSGILSSEIFNYFSILWDKILQLSIPISFIYQGAVPGDTTISEWLKMNAPHQIYSNVKSEESHNTDMNYKEANVKQVEKDKKPQAKEIEKKFSLDDICARNGFKECNTLNPLDLYLNENQWGNPITFSDYPTFINLKKKKIMRVDALLAGIQKHNIFNRVILTNFTSAGFKIELRNDLDYFSATWEQALITLIENFHIPGVQLYIKTERSINDELFRGSHLSGFDLILILFSALCVTIYTTFMNSSQIKHKSKVFPALVGIVTTVLAFGSGVGLCHLLGVKHVPPAEATPFIVLGICIDNVFVMINAYTMTYIHGNSARRRVSLALRDAGMSISITTLTSIIAFLIGSISPYYAISTFCLLTVSAITISYILCLTVFLGALSLTAMYEEKKESTSLDIRTVELSSFDSKEKSFIKETDVNNNKNNYYISIIKKSFNNIIKLDNINSFKDSPSDTPDMSQLYKNNSKYYENYSKDSSDEKIDITSTDTNTIENKLSYIHKYNDGYYSIEEVDNYVVVSERVKKIYNMNKKFNIDKIVNNHKNIYIDPSLITRIMALENDGKLRIFSDINFDEPKGNVGSSARNFFLKYYGPWLVNKYVKKCIMVIFILITIFATYSIKYLKEGLDINDVTPYNSYIRDFYDIRQKLFNNYGDEFTVVFNDPEINWSSKLTQTALRNINNKLENDENTIFSINGFIKFLDWIEKTNETLITNDYNNFVSQFKIWQTSTPTGMFLIDSFIIKNEKLNSWKFTYWSKFNDNSHKSINNLLKIRRLFNEEKHLPHAYIYTPFGIHWESDINIFKSCLINLLAALLAMAGVACILISDIQTGVLIIIVISMIDLCVIGLMPLLGLKLNMLTTVNLVLSIGFAVDYTAHITHCFSHCKGESKNHRAIETLVLMGSPVSNGVLTSYGAIAALALSNKNQIITLFKMMSLVLGFAYLYGIIFMPVLLTYYGPLRSHVVKVIEIKENQIINKYHVDINTGEVHTGATVRMSF